MKVGDLVEYAGREDEAVGRTHGIVMRFDVYETDGRTDNLVEVLWGTGLSWILKSRIKVAR